MIEKEVKYIEWHYSELINYNSIVTLNPIHDYTSIKFILQVSDPISSNIDLMLFFALKNYRDFYAFKYVIEKKKDAQIQFINSKIKDPSLKPAVKKNFNIDVLQLKKFDFDYDKKYNIEIKINKNKAELFIDGKKEMEASAQENLDSGRIGFSSRKAQLRIEDVKVYSGEKIVFQDDFSTDSIKRWKVRAKRVNSKE